MRIDLYTKGILTIIAACLVWLCVALTSVGTPVHAQASSANSRVLIAGWVDATGGLHSLDPILGTTYGIPVMTRSHAPLTAGSSATAESPAAAAPATTAPQTAVGTVTPRTTTAAPTGSDARIRCQATTQRGTQCSRLADIGKRFCWQHGGR